MKHSLVFLFAFFLPFSLYAFDTGRIFEEINKARVSEGLVPLLQNEKLDLAAFRKATTLTLSKTLTHTQSQTGVPWSFIEDAGYLYDNAGENLAVNFKTEAEVVSDWMRSSSHRANILRPDFKEIGISAVDGLYQGGDASYVVTYFAKPDTDQASSSVSQQDAQIKLILELINILTNLLLSLQAQR